MLICWILLVREYRETVRPRFCSYAYHLYLATHIRAGGGGMCICITACNWLHINAGGGGGMCICIGGVLGRGAELIFIKFEACFY